MPDGQGELPNLVLEHLHLMRAEISAHRAETKTQYDQMRAETNARFDKIDGEIAGLKATMRGFERNTIVEIYKANLTVASFLDHEQRLSTLERKSS